MIGVYKDPKGESVMGTHTVDGSQTLNSVNMLKVKNYSEKNEAKL